MQIVASIVSRVDGLEWNKRWGANYLRVALLQVSKLALRMSNLRWATIAILLPVLPLSSIPPRPLSGYFMLIANTTAPLGDDSRGFTSGTGGESRHLADLSNLY